MNNLITGLFGAIILGQFYLVPSLMRQNQFFLITTTVLLIITLFFAVIFTSIHKKTSAEPQDNDEILVSHVDMIYFYQTTCGVCDEVKPTIERLATAYETNFRKYEVTENDTNLSRFGAFANEYGIKITDNHVPVVYIGDKYFQGQAAIEDDMEEQLKNCTYGSKECDLLIDPDSSEAIEYRYTGGVNCTDGTRCEVNTGLSIWILVTTAIIDSINPCAIAVLILLITYLLNIKLSKKKMFLLGAYYIGAVFLAYLLAGLGLLRFLENVNLTDTVRYIIIGVILILAMVNLKDAIQKDQKSILAIPDSAKPVIKRYLSKATFPALIATGFIVAAVELPCTGAVYLGVLSLLKGEAFAKGLLYLLIYNLIFVLPLIVILVLSALGKDISYINKLRKEKKHFIKIAMTIVMLLLALLLLPGNPLGNLFR